MKPKSVTFLTAATYRAVQVLATASATLGRYSEPENEQTVYDKCDKQQTKTRLSHAQVELQAIAGYDARFKQKYHANACTRCGRTATSRKCLSRAFVWIPADLS